MQTAKHVTLAEQLYCEERVTLGRAAKMAGMSYAKFAKHLSTSGMAVVDYPPEDLEYELKVLSLSQLE